MCEGFLTKTHAKSWFKRLKYDGNLTKRIFEKDADIVVIQILPQSDYSFIAELVSREDYEEESQ